MRLRRRAFEELRPRVKLHLTPAQDESGERVNLLLDGCRTARVLLPVDQLLQEQLSARNEATKRRADAEGREPLADLVKQLESRMLRPLSDELTHAFTDALNDRSELADFLAILLREDLSRLL